jgi:hypothetical protein
MDVINDRIIDVGLNVLGYLIAGGLGMLLHSSVQARRLRRVATPVAATPTEVPATRTVPVGDPGNGLEFVSFGADAQPAAPEPVLPPSSLHRNRREIIRLAREMLQAGTAGDQIKKTLPISQSELALLKNARSN